MFLAFVFHRKFIEEIQDSSELFNLCNLYKRQILYHLFVDPENQENLN